jgi:hypothetical protein
MGAIMLIELWERLRGYDKWIETEATVESSRVENIQFRNAGYQQSDDVLLWTDRKGERHRAYFEARAGSPPYDLVQGSKVVIRYDPANPDRYYLCELLKNRVVKATISGFLGAVVAGALVFLIARMWLSLSAVSH